MSLEPLASERPTLPPPLDDPFEVPSSFRKAARALAERLGLDVFDMLTIAGEAIRIGLDAEALKDAVTARFKGRDELREFTRTQLAMIVDALRAKPAGDGARAYEHDPNEPE